MAVNDHLKHPLQACGPQVRMARFRFTPAASPALQVLSEGKGVASITRTGAGAWTVQLTDTKVKDLECFVGCIENDTTVMHQVRVESQSASAGTVAISHKTLTFASMADMVIVPMSHMTDLATAETIYGVSPVAGTIALIQTQVTGGGASDGEATVTFSIDGTPITNGVVTVESGAVVGDVDTATPTAANTVAVGSVITGLSNAGGSATTALDAQLVVQATTASTPAGSDTVDQIYGVIFYRVVD